VAPHSYPFQLIDRPAVGVGEDRAVEVKLTAGSALLRGEGPLSLFLLIEIAAQAALRLAEGSAPEGEKVLLAGVEEMSILEGADPRPMQPGDCLRVRGREEAKIAKLIKMRVEIDRDGTPLAQGMLLLVAA
jgi:hypothetical protein